GDAPTARGGGLAVVLAEGPVGVAELGDDLVGAQVPRETLLAGRAERAVHRAPRLGGHAQRAAVGLRYEDGLDGVAPADVEQPFAGPVVRDMVGHDRGLLHARPLG